MTWYVGDPCYIIPDDEWSEFCELTLTGAGGDRDEGGHVDSVIEWRGQEITLWTNGGDGTWGFVGLESENKSTFFGVDAGIFCAIDLEKLKGHYEGDPATCGIIFAREPNLYVEDGCVWLNGHHDDGHMACDNFQCGRVISDCETLSCGYGCCEGCDYCGYGWECEEE